MKKVLILDKSTLMSSTYNSYFANNFSEKIIVEFYNNYNLFFEALELKKGSPDLIIMDYVNEQSIDIETIVKKIRVLYTNVPILVVSAFFTTDIITTLHTKYDVNKCLEKPLDGSKFLTIVNSIFLNDVNRKRFTPPSTKKIVIILEDVSVMFNLYQHYLGTYFDVIHIRNFKDLKHFIDKENVELIIMDYIFHNGDINKSNYKEVLIYAVEQYKKAKRLLISGFVDLENLEEMYGNHFHGILSKPLDSYANFTKYVNNMLKIENTKRQFSRNFN